MEDRPLHESDFFSKILQACRILFRIFYETKIDNGRKRIVIIGKINDTHPLYITVFVASAYLIEIPVAANVLDLTRTFQVIDAIGTNFTQLPLYDKIISPLFLSVLFVECVCSRSLSQHNF